MGRAVHRRGFAPAW